MKDVLKYCSDIETGKIPACIHVKKAIARFRADLKRKDLDFREDRYDRVVKFISCLEHYSGRFEGKKFLLEPWQKFIVANLYGFYRKDGHRRFTSAYLEVAKKNGKTALSAAFCLYHLIADFEGGAEILLAANSREQAKIAFKHCKEFTKRLDPLADLLKPYRADIVFDRTGSILKVLAADSSKMDGYNGSMSVIDEFHGAPNSQVRDVIKSGMAMRENPLLVTITTAGFNLSAPCFELRRTAVEVVSGIKQDDSFFSLVYTLDDKDDWADSEMWIKSNPNLGVTVRKDFIKQQVLEAKNNPSDEIGVKTKNLNIWCDSAEAWLPESRIMKATKKLTFESMEGQEVFMGVDLAESRDLTAVSYMWIKDEKYYFYTDFYIPAACLKTHSNRELYKPWVRQGFVKTTPGNVTDYDCIIEDILKANETCEIEYIAYDTWNAKQWAIKCTDQGLPIEPYSQTVPNFNSPTKEFERLLFAGKVVLANNPAMRYCFRNVQLKRDWNGNVKPNKGIDKKKIDGVIAALQALAMFLEYNETVGGGNIY